MLPRKFFAFLFFLELVIITLIPTNLSSQVLSLEQVRKEFSFAVKGAQSCNDLYNKMILASDSSNAVWMAYYGTVTMTMAKYTVNPFRKLQYFKEGKILIDQSIMKEPKNIEVRFLRFTVQDHSPFFLDYHQEIEGDKKYILDNLEKIPFPGLKKAIANYISQCERFSESEKKWAANIVIS